MINEQIKKQYDSSPYAIVCASDRQIEGLGNMVKGYLNHESTALNTASAIAILVKDPDHKEAKELIERNFKDGNQNNIIEMLGFLRSSPELVSHDQMLSVLESNNNEINNSGLAIIGQDPNLNFFDHVIKLLAKPATATHAEKALLSYPRDTISDRLLNNMSNTNSRQNIRKTILRIICNIFFYL